MSYENIIKNTSDYRTRLLASLADKDEAVAYLKVALEEYEEDHNTEIFMLALRNVAEARGGISELSEKTKLNREHLYRMLSKRGNPRLITLDTVLRGLGFRLSIEAA
jgi:probable addiction module antidote protein